MMEPCIGEDFNTSILLTLSGMVVSLFIAIAGYCIALQDLVVGLDRRRRESQMAKLYGQLIVWAVNKTLPGATGLH